MIRRGSDHRAAPTEGEPSDEVVAQRLGQLVREATDAVEVQRRSSVAARRTDLAARQRLGAAIAGDGERRGVVTRWRVLAAAAALALVGGVVVGGRALRSDGLDYAVAGASEVGGYVRAGDAPATVTFQDGSELVFAPGSAGRVGDRTARGARVALEDGSVDVRIEKVPGADWALQAGPWEVRVIGTAFRLTWDARVRALRIDLHEGRVSVRGPGAEEGVGLRAGQALEAREGGGVRLMSLAASSAAAPDRPPGPAQDPSTATPSAAPAVASAAVAPGEKPEEGTPTEGAAPPVPARTSWSARVAAGEFDAVLAEADERGIESVLATAGAADLVALGDAARYRGRSGVASRTLTALRDRFPGTPQAANAAFLLARMADDGGSAASAIRWYDVHMAEGGAFATEALGRKMLAVRRSQGDAAATSVARQYLSRHPKGPHAPIAKSLLGQADSANGEPSPR